MSTLGKNSRLNQVIQNLKDVTETIERKRLLQHATQRQLEDTSINMLNTRTSSSDSCYMDTERMQRESDSDPISSASERFLKRYPRKRQLISSNPSTNTMTSTKIITDMISCIDSVRFLHQACLAINKRIIDMTTKDGLPISMRHINTAMNPSIPLSFQSILHSNYTILFPQDNLSSSLMNTNSSMTRKVSKDIDSDESLVDVSYDDLECGSSKSNDSGERSQSRASNSSSATSSSSLVKVSSSQTKGCNKNALLALTSESHPRELSFSSSSSSSYSPSRDSMISADISIGALIPTHTGHNGWPEEEELQKIREYIRYAGFDIKM